MSDQAGEAGARSPRPTIGIVVPTRRRAGYLADALESIQSQTWRVDEVVISEDGKDDETARVVDRYRQAGLPIRHVWHEPPLGLRHNRRTALMLSTGSLIAMLDDDDAYESEFIAQTAQALIEHPECGFATTDQAVMDEHGSHLAAESDDHARRFGRHALAPGVHKDVLTLELELSSFPIQTTLLRRTALAQTSFFTEARGIDDFALFIELGALRIPGFYIAERLGRYRWHNESATSTPDERLTFGLAMLDDLRFLASRFKLEPHEARTLSALYRATVLEAAIACAHRSERIRAASMLKSFGELGWGLPRPRRTAVLIALLLGARKRRDAAQI